MDSTLNNLLNNVAQQSNLKQLPAELLGKPQVIQALVLSSILLPDPVPGNENSKPQLPLINTPPPAPGQPQTPAANVLAQLLTYRVAIQWQGRVLHLLSPQPLPQGKPVELQIGARGEVTLLPPRADRTAALIATTPTAPLTTAAPTQRAPVLPPALAPMPQALREILPRQQPLHTLLPVLQKLAAPAMREQLPPPVAKAVAQLLEKLPQPQQLRSPEGVKRAIDNSGSLLEARLARVATQPQASPDSAPEILASDVKAQVVRLFALVRQLGLATPQQPQARAPQTAEGGEELTYSKPVARDPAQALSLEENADSADALLTQLGKLLQGGLARIQLHQLDSASTRHPIDSNAQPPAPTWVFELPIQTPRGADNLQLRIEQRRAARGDRTRMQWIVQLAFDLHELGKLAATLTVVDRDVAATLWSEREHTHRAVQEEIDNLRRGLEAAGVKVTEVQCRLGLPPDRNALLARPLVDVHT